MFKYIVRIIPFLLIFTSGCKEGAIESNYINQHEISVLDYGASGDGITDDSDALQNAFNVCSEQGLTCKIPKNNTFLVTKPLFLWGKSNLVGDDFTGVIEFRDIEDLYLINIGISGKNKIEEPFSGTISKVNFKVSGGEKGRIIYLWRTQNAYIIDNLFDVGNFPYSATSSGDMNSWLSNVEDYIRKDITIKRNTIIAAADYKGSEGIGLGSFDGAIINDNIIIGVGDDPIGVHYSRNIKILNNFMTSVDGRLYVSNSVNVEIRNNNVQRIASFRNNKVYKGISLIYIGFERYDIKSTYSAPTNINVIDNELYYFSDSIDVGAGIYVYGPRNVNIARNLIVNDSKNAIASAIHLLPAYFSANWYDPEGLDGPSIARVWNVSIHDNIIGGDYPQKIKMTGKCVEYAGKASFRNNIASDYQVYCSAVEDYENKKINIKN